MNVSSMSCGVRGSWRSSKKRRRTKTISRKSFCRPLTVRWARGGRRWKPVMAKTPVQTLLDLMLRAGALRQRQTPTCGSTSRVVPLVGRTTQLPVPPTSATSGQRPTTGHDQGRWPRPGALRLRGSLLRRGRRAGNAPPGLARDPRRQGEDLPLQGLWPPLAVQDAKSTSTRADQRRPRHLRGRLAPRHRQFPRRSQKRRGGQPEGGLWPGHRHCRKTCGTMLCGRDPATTTQPIAMLTQRRCQSRQELHRGPLRSQAGQARRRGTAHRRHRQW